MYCRKRNLGPSLLGNVFSKKEEIKITLSAYEAALQEWDTNTRHSSENVLQRATRLLEEVGLTAARTSSFINDIFLKKS